MERKERCRNRYVGCCGDCSFAPKILKKKVKMIRERDVGERVLKSVKGVVGSARGKWESLQKEMLSRVMEKRKA